jgi:TRAP-type mannitol/chloroaromatic compound transport system substrate-binding protein
VLEMKKLSLFVVVISLISGIFFSISVEAQEKAIKWKVQSGSPAGDFMFVNIKDLVAKIDEMSNGRLQIEVLPAGAVVPTFEILEGVHKGIVDAGHCWTGWWLGKNPAAGLFGGAPGGPFGMNDDDFMGWYYFGGGWELYNEMFQKEIKYNVIGFATQKKGPEMLGWFKKPVKSVAEFKGLKFRTSGMTAQIFKEMGMSVVTLPPGEMLPALERGVVDGAEICDAAVDMSLGLHTVRKIYMMPSLQQVTGMMELFIKKDKWDALPPDLKAIVKWACTAESLSFTLKSFNKNTEALETLVKEHGVTIVETPHEINIEMLKAWDRVAERLSKENAFFAKVLDSQKAWAKRVVPYRMTAHPPYGLAAEYYWKDVNPYMPKKP